MKKNGLYFRFIFMVLIVYINGCEKDESENSLPLFCNILTPADSTKFHIGDTITINVEATDPDDQIRTVMFCIDGAGKYSTTQLPYQFEWITSNESPGTHIIRATVIDRSINSALDECRITLVYGPPIVSTADVSYFTQNSAQSGGNVTDDGGVPVTVKGVCWSTFSNPTIYDNVTNDGSGTGSFISSITGLEEGTTYYLRAYATNSMGTTYSSNEYKFITLAYSSCQGSPTLMDYDGNVYGTVQIGDQCWMNENLKATGYNNGKTIPLVTDNTVWSNLITPAYCYYSNDKDTNKDVYGALYNWHTVNTGKLCPIGWHVPTDSEWTTLTNYLGGLDVAGGKLKETGTAHWKSPNAGATNETAFTALPGGSRRGNDGGFENIGNSGYWWSSSKYSSAQFMFYLYDNMKTGGNNEKNGFSVRCIRD